LKGDERKDGMMEATRDVESGGFEGSAKGLSGRVGRRRRWWKGEWLGETALGE
jgi:hypothetical protein